MNFSWSDSIAQESNTLGGRNRSFLPLTFISFGYARSADDMLLYRPLQSPHYLLKFGISQFSIFSLLVSSLLSLLSLIVFSSLSFLSFSVSVREIIYPVRDKDSVTLLSVHYGFLRRWRIITWGKPANHVPEGGAVTKIMIPAQQMVYAWSIRRFVWHLCYVCAIKHWVLALDTQEQVQSKE